MMHLYIETVLDLNPYANCMTDQLEIANQKSYSKETKAIIALFIASLIFGIMPILIRWSENEISPNATIFNRCWIAAVFFGLWQEISLTHQRRLGEQPIVKESLNNQQILLLLATSVFCCATQVFWAWSLTETNVANSALIHNLTPFFTALGGYLFFSQRFDYKFIIGLAIAGVGTIVLGLGDLQVASIKLQGDLLALLSALFYAAYFLGIEKLRTQLTVTTILSWIYRIITLFFVVIILTVKDEWFPHSWNGWLAVITLALALIFSHGLTVYSLKHLSSSLVAMINLFDPAVTGFFAWMIFAEALNWLNLVAFAIIVLGIYLALNSQGGIKSVAE
jgi:drug/metabolite transporter (DMT)-like permease